MQKDHVGCGRWVSTVPVGFSLLLWAGAVWPLSAPGPALPGRCSSCGSPGLCEEVALQVGGEASAVPGARWALLRCAGTWHRRWQPQGLGSSARPCSQEHSKADSPGVAACRADRRGVCVLLCEVQYLHGPLDTAPSLLLWAASSVPSGCQGCAAAPGGSATSSQCW